MRRPVGNGNDMTDQLNHLWRVFATGLSFASFGVGGVLLRVLAFPMLNLLVREHARRGSIARAIIRRSFAMFIEWMRLLGVLSYQIDGRERLQRQGLLVLANHPTLIDVVFLVALVPDADCIVKSRLAHNPFTRGPIRASGYLCNDSGSGLVEDCIASLRSGKNLLIFPEGTRSPPDGLGKFQRGAANIAVRNECDVTPVLIRCTPPTLGKGLPWYRVPSRRFHVSIQVLQDIPCAPFRDGASDPLAARRLTDYLTRYFQMELQRAVART